MSTIVLLALSLLASSALVAVSSVVVETFPLIVVVSVGIWCCLLSLVSPEQLEHGGISDIGVRAVSLTEFLISPCLSNTTKKHVVSCAMNTQITHLITRGVRPTQPWRIHASAQCRGTCLENGHGQTE